jgi:hypothetical protein
LRSCSEDVAQNAPDEASPLITGGEQLGQQGCFVIMRIYVGRSPFIVSGTFSYKMVSNALALLFQG